MQESHGGGLRELWSIARRRRWLIAGGLLAGAALGTGVALRHEQVYTGAAVIRVDEKRPDLPSLDPRASAPAGKATGNQVGAEMEVLRSRALAAMVVDSLRLQVQMEGRRPPAALPVLASVQVAPEAPEARYRFTREAGGRFRVQQAGGAAHGRPYAAGEPVPLGGAVVVLGPGAGELPFFDVAVLPREAAVGALIARLRVRRPSPDASIVRVEYRDSDPGLARAVPNLLAAQFIDLRRSTQRTEARSTIAFLREQLDTIGTQLAATEQELQAFREANRVVDPDVERVTQVQQLAEMQGQRATADVERASLAVLLDEVRSSSVGRSPDAPSPYRRLMAFPALLRSPAASELLRSLVRVEDERATLLTRRSAVDPDVQVLTGRIRELEAELQANVTTYLRGLESQVNALDSQLGRYQQGLDRIPSREVRFSRLSRQAGLLQEVYGQLQTRLKEAEVVHAAEDPSVRIVDLAVPAMQPLGFQRARTIGLLALLGLLAGLGAALLREARDRSVRSRSDLQLATGLPVLGLIPRFAGARRALPARPAKALPSGRRALAAPTGGAVATVRPDAPRADTPAGRLVACAGAPTLELEAYRRLHLNLRWAGMETAQKTYLFTSPLPGDGKTTTAVNFALSLAQAGQRVVLVDADMRRGTVARVFEAGDRPGLAELLTQPIPPAQVVRTADAGNGGVLHYVPAGRPPASPGELLGGDRMQVLADWLKSEFDVVVFDTPPLNVVTDAAVLAALADAVVLVVRAAVTPVDALEYAANELRSARAAVAGTVLNDLVLKRDATYDSGYQWYEYGKAYYAGTAGAR